MSEFIDDYPNEPKEITCIVNGVEMKESDIIYEANMIFTGEYLPSAAMWCNNSGKHYISEIDKDGEGNRCFKIVRIPDPTLEEIRTRALSRVDAVTSSNILAGFDHEIDGVMLHFSYDAFDQQNFADTANVATLAMNGVAGLPTSITWNAYSDYTEETGGNLVRIEFEAADFLALYTQGALVHKATQMELGGQRKEAINDCGSIEEINTLLTEWNI